MHSWRPEKYAESSSAQSFWAEELLRKIEIEGCERVLDIGCGDGKVTAKIADLVPRGSVLGIDSSREMVRFAIEKFPPESHPNLRFVEADARDLSFDEEFDLVVSFAALHWIEDHGPVLRGIRRALRPGGRTFLQFGGRGNAAAPLKIADEMTGEERWRSCFEGFDFQYGFFGPDEYRVWLKEAGLSPLRAELIPKEMVQSNPAAFAGWIETTWHPYLERVPEDRRRDFVSEIVDRYLREHPLDAEGRVHVGMTRLEVVAEKGRS
ncbi:MAG: methyltransferase domain-containing protein [Methanothrix sp.]|uniref:Methyltransferase, putative n=1 Tax=Methanothrix harundinacea TaxID=301375 RepID=A0A101IIJ8_9EURY|nr:MAG: Methyltransferase, putative [Methanothrix harundinacea]MDD2638077.1 methyltransferase domain-containing protein [Methanothrix sp.]MDI9399904.1 methyltransferase domain-containing protein [Euryarchaeota archaeon]KUK95520.1 MAG: Methyltransferase, putative [Methanothrix harundinacea]MCP1392120.1 methyltransferase domain-containing protein [Methanothrix harundinacea]